MKIPRNFPPVVYVPCIEQTESASDARVRLRVTRDGRSALLVYSALDRLHTCFGPDEPWLVLPIAQLHSLWEAAPFDLNLLDVVVPDHERTTSR